MSDATGKVADLLLCTQAMERELCTHLNTLAVSLLSEAAGALQPKEPGPVSKGKGKKRAADTGALPVQHSLSTGEP